jgi:hypothetical protein
MLLLPHTVIAIAIALTVGNPFGALLLAFLSHFALDFIPHWDPPGLRKSLESEGTIRLDRKLITFISTDFLISLALGLFFAWRALPDVRLSATVVGASFLANLPDGASLLVILGRRWAVLSLVRRFHCFAHTTRLSFWWGILVQACVAAIGLLIALR